MSISDELKQRAFQNVWHELRVNLLFTASWFRGEVKQFLDPHEVTQQQFNILRILRGSYPDALTTLEIRDRMVDKMSDASRLVDRLVKKGLVEKRPCRHDRRRVDVRILDAGLRLLSDIDARMQDLDLRTQGSLTAEEAEQLSHLLDRMRHG
ncbi:MAG: MarR family winged helix-turn-helix transcriptional regulator [Bacteroidota bacterium]